jgi:hypothetical protein
MIDHSDGVFHGGDIEGRGLVGALEAFADRDQCPDKYFDTWISRAGRSADAILAAARRASLLDSVRAPATAFLKGWNPDESVNLKGHRFASVAAAQQSRRGMSSATPSAAASQPGAVT